MVWREGSVPSAVWARASHLTSLDYSVILWEASEGLDVSKSSPISEVSLMWTGHSHKWKYPLCHHASALWLPLWHLHPLSPHHTTLSVARALHLLPTWHLPKASLPCSWLFPSPLLHQPITTFRSWVPFPLDSAWLYQWVMESSYVIQRKYVCILARGILEMFWSILLSVHSLMMVCHNTCLCTCLGG